MNGYDGVVGGGNNHRGDLNARQKANGTGSIVIAFESAEAPNPGQIEIVELIDSEEWMFRPGIARQQVGHHAAHPFHKVAIVEAVAGSFEGGGGGAQLDWRIEGQHALD